MKVCLDRILENANTNEQDRMAKIVITIKRIQEHNWRVFSRYKLFRKQFFLGYDLINTGLCAQKNKIENVLQMAPPTSIKLIQGFIGMLNCYHRMCTASIINMQPLISITSPEI